MLGLTLALLSGFSFAVSNIFVRKGTYRSGESVTAVVITAFMGLVLFGIPLLITGQFTRLGSVSWLALGSLAAAGIVHFSIGRMLGFSAIRLIGANRAVPIQTCYILIAAFLGVFFLGEHLSTGLILALIFVVVGVALISTTGNTEGEKAALVKGVWVKGLLATLGAAICWGVSPVLTKIGLKEVGNPLLATFISYMAASIVVGSSLFSRSNTEKLGRLSRAAWISFVIAGLATSVAQILRYTALDYSTVSLATPLVATNSFFVFPLSFLINRQIEAFNLRIILGAAAIIIGIFLIFWIG